MTVTDTTMMLIMTTTLRKKRWNVIRCRLENLLMSRKVLLSFFSLLTMHMKGVSKLNVATAPLPYAYRPEPCAGRATTQRPT